MAQKTFGSEYHQRFAPFAQRLTPQGMKILRGCRRLNDLNVVLRREGEESFQPRARMLGPHALKAMRQQQYQSGQPPPFIFRAADKLVEDDLCRIDEITELRLPNHQTIRAIEAVAIFETKRARFAKRAIVDFDG